MDKIKPFALRVEEDGGDHYYGVLDKVCVLNQNCDHKKSFGNLVLSKKRTFARF